MSSIDVVQRLYILYGRVDNTGEKRGAVACIDAL
jgi:hypothetical protein